MVHDERGNFVGDAHWREDYDLGEGEELELERGGVMVQVAECTGSRDQDLSELIDKRAQERAERQAAAMARRQAIHEPATPSANTPHFQLRHKPLHNLIGTPTGHHGRALIPKESPYEERQKSVATPQSDSARPAKRRKREVSPPSKSGYARSLFGTTLTLSGAPTSTPPIRHKPPRSSPVPIDDPAPTSSDPVPHDNRSDPAPEMSRTMTADLSRERRINVPRPQLLKSISRTYPSNMVTEPGSPSVPIEVDSDPDENRDSATGTRKSGLKRKEKTSSRARNSDLLQPISANRLNSPKSKGRPDSFGDASSLASLGRKEAAVPVPTRGLKTSTRNQLHSAKPKPKRPAEALNSNDERSNVTKEQPMSEPRTELRIPRRKKRGLLMMSENLDVDDLPTPRIAKSRIDRPSPSISFEDSAIGDFDIAPGQRKSADMGIGDSEDDVPLPKSRNKRNRDTRKRHREVPIDEDVEVTPDASNYPIQDELSDEIVPGRKRSKTNDRRIKSPSPPLENTDLSEPTESPRRKQPPRKTKLALTEEALGRRSREDKSDEEQFNPSEDRPPVPNGVPAPRLAQLGRKSIRSREVIGFMFDEDDFSSAPQRSEGRDGTSRRGHVPQNQSVMQSATPVAKHTNPTTTHSDRVTTSDQLPDDPVNTAKKAVNNATVESVNNLCIVASDVESIQQDQAREQTDPVSVPLNAEPQAQAQVAETTILMQQPPTKRVVNPASRGKKAAKPSDAAGQVPQCPLPPEVAVGKPLENSRLKPRPENRPRETTTAPMPGFSRANGGPWSREAHDLFEHTRPR